MLSLPPVIQEPSELTAPTPAERRRGSWTHLVAELDAQLNLKAAVRRLVKAGSISEGEFDRAYNAFKALQWRRRHSNRS